MVANRTGRHWECPRCKKVVHEADVEWSAATCTKTQQCRNKGAGTPMTLVES